MNVRVLQTNLKRKKHALNNVIQETMRKEDISIAIISEPTKETVKENLSNPNWITDKKSNVIIVINKDKINVANIKKEEKKKEKTSGFVWVWETLTNYIFIGCYLSLSQTNNENEYREYLKNLQKLIRSKQNEDDTVNIILAGDLNSKSYRWGSPDENKPGSILAEWLDEMDLEIVNTGNVPTFFNAKSESHIDITACTSFTRSKIESWNVDDIEDNFSDHRNIIFSINTSAMQNTSYQNFQITDQELQYNINLILLSEHSTDEWKDVLVNTVEEDNSNIANPNSNYHKILEKLTRIHHIARKAEQRKEFCVLVTFDIRHIGEDDFYSQLFQDPILRMPDGVTLIRDHEIFAIVICATESMIVNHIKRAVRDIWRKQSLRLDSEHINAVLLIGQKEFLPEIVKCQQINVEILDSLKYLSFVFDTSMTMKKHSEHVAKETELARKTVIAEMEIRNIPRTRQMQILHTIVNTTLMFCAPLYKNLLFKDKNYDDHIKTLSNIQRRFAIKVSHASSTVSTEVLLVVAGVVPIDLQIDAQWALFMGQSEQERRSETMFEWQRKWERYRDNEWTRTLIPDINPWVNRKHGELNKYITQFLTGHGCFQKHLVLFDKRLVESDRCIYPDCGNPDDVKHIVFECQNWNHLRTGTENNINGRLSAENVVHIMLESESNWNTIASLLKKIISKKETTLYKLQRDDEHSEFPDEPEDDLNEEYSAIQLTQIKNEPLDEIDSEEIIVEVKMEDMELSHTFSENEFSLQF